MNNALTFTPNKTKNDRGAKARYLEILVRKIKAVSHMILEKNGHSERRRTLAMKKVKELVDEFNVLVLPRGALGVDEYGQVHLTMFRNSDDDAPSVYTGTKLGMSLGIVHYVDFMYTMSGDGTVKVVKNRYGEEKTLPLQRGDNDLTSCDIVNIITDVLTSLEITVA